MSRYSFYNVKDIADVARKRQLNKYDCLIGIFGARGVGKSSLAVRLAYAIKRYEVEHYGKIYKGGGFNMKNDMVYSRGDMMHLFKDRKFKIIMGDEMINAAYNREFNSSDQQSLIKILNQYRSNYNIFILCNPFFYDLDPDLRNLITMRIDVVRRGVGLIHTPNDSIYSNDRWDTKYNQVVEKSWLQRNLRSPRYKQLTTFRGIIKYPPLPSRVEQKYERIRDEKRNKANPIDEEEDTLQSRKLLYERLYKVLIKNELSIIGFYEYIKINGLKEGNVRQYITKRLRATGEKKSINELLNQKQVDNHMVSAGGRIIKASAKKKRMDELGYDIEQYA